MSLMTPVLIPWRELTRFGTPPESEFRVIRRPIESLGVKVEPGQTLPDGFFRPEIRPVRLRQFYEQHRIELVNVPSGVGLVERAKQRMRDAMQDEPLLPLDPTVGRQLDDWANKAAEAETSMVSIPFDPEPIALADETETDPDPDPVPEIRAKVKPNFRRQPPGPPKVAGA